MAVDWMQEFANSRNQAQERKQKFSDDYRKAQNDQLTNATHNIQKMIALMVNPDTMQPMPGKEQAVAGLRAQLNQISEYQKQLANPKFDPVSGKIPEDPLHKLSDKLHLTKAPVQPNVEGGRQAVTNFSDSTAVDAATEKQQLERKVEDTRSLLKKYGATDATIQEITEGMLGGAKPGVGSTSKWGQYLRSYARKLGKEVSELTPEELDAANKEFSSSGRQDKEDWVQDPQSSTGYSKRTRDASGRVTGIVRDVLPPRGYIARETISTDPFGVTSTSVSKPVIGNSGAVGNGKPSSTPKQSKPPGVQKRELQSKIGQPKSLDAQGHIPQSDHVNPQLREAANNLLDGMAVKDLPIPAKDKGAAEALAKQYGWAGQGMFTPRDKLLVRESTAILSQLSLSPSLSVLDDPTSRQKLMQVLQNPEKRGAIGQGFQAYVASNLTPQEQEFVTLYNQAVGRISGLSQLVRSGRATEAQIERLKSELPNPATTANSDHARQKLKQIQSEIDIALQKGQFVDDSGASGMSDDQFLIGVSGGAAKPE